MSALAGMAALLLATAAEIPADAPASPRNRRPPVYPATCLPPPDVTKAPQSVTVAFTVDRNGLPENVRVQETSDPCFNEAAIAAVRGWTYDPARIDGDRTEQELEVTFTFVLAEPTEVLEFIASINRLSRL